jgi:iron complex outermembrane recepter protein
MLQLKKSYLMMAPAIVMAAQSTLVQAAQLEEVLVTATKRQQTAQDIPMSVEVMSGDTIDRNSIRDMADLSASVPSFIVTESAGDRNITMRGMGSPSAQRGIEQAVAMYVDGVYKPRSKQYYSAFLDVDRVEILRGPQAVLFGINATAGAINILSRSNRPGDEFEAKIKIGTELEDGGEIAEIAVGGGIGDTLGVRGVFKYEDLDGFADTNSGPGGQEENMSGRLSLVWEPSENFTLTAKGDYFDVTYEGQLSEQICALPTEQCQFNSPDLSSRFPSSPSNSYEHDTPALDLTGELDGPGYEIDGYNISLQLDWMLGEHTLSAIFSDSEFDHVMGNDFDSGAFVAPNVHGMSADSFGEENFEQQTLELRLVSPGDEFIDYAVGVYYQDSDMEDRASSMATFIEQAGLFDVLGPLVGLEKGPEGPWDIPFGFGHVSQDQELWSAYANVTFNLTDSLALTVGGRYTDETKTVERSRSCGTASDGLNTVEDSAGTGACATYDAFLGVLGLSGTFYATPENTVGTKQDLDTDNFLPEVSIAWDFHDNHNLWARYAASAKSGGMSSSFGAIPGNLTFDEETVDAYEVGIKSRFADGRGELNATAFYNQYEDLQVTSITLAGSVVDNAGEATIQGIEVDGRYLLADWLTIGASVAWLDAEYDEFDTAACAAGPSKSKPNGDGSCDASGLEPPMAADFTYNVFADAIFPLSDNLNLIAGLSASGSTDYVTEGTFNENMRQDDWDMYNGYIGIEQADGQWNINLAGRNLGDEVLGGPGIDLGGAFFTNSAVGTKTHRSVFLTAEYNF